MFRIGANILLFVSIVLLPWWVALILGVIFLFTFSSFYEIILWALLGDLLYGTNIVSFYGVNIFLSLGALFLFVVSKIAKDHIRFYS